MTSDWEVVLREGVLQLGLDLQDGFASLVSYTRELERWNRQLGLVHAFGSELIIRHILDSLAGVEIVASLIVGRDAPVIADIGTGGGLPGAPLACFLPQAQFHLIERSRRKCGFLRGALLAARISNAMVVNEDWTALHEPFDLILFRAFQPLSESLVTRLTELLRPSGAVCAYKGRTERIREEIDSLGENLTSRLLVESQPVRVPFLAEERHLVVLKPRG